MDQSPDAMLIHKDSYYENVTRTVRWLAVLSVVATYPMEGSRGIIIFTLIVFAIIYNALRYSSWMMSQKLFASKLNMLFTDHFFVFSLIIFSGGINSPYYFFMIFMITTSAYWYGIKGFLAVLAAQIAFTGIMLPTINTVGVPQDVLHTTAIKLVILITVGVLTERFTHAERTERLMSNAANSQIEGERQRLAALINSLADAVIAVNNQGVITMYNGAALDLINTNTDLVGKGINDLLPLVDNQNNDVRFMDVVAKTEVDQKRDDLIYVTGEGNKVNLDMSIAPIYTSENRKHVENGYIFILRDVTKEKSLEQQRDEFISVASHELRTPLTIAEANISTALLPGYAKIDPKAKALLEQAHQNIIFLGELIKDLTTLSRAEVGVLDVDLSMVDSKQLIEKIQRDYKAEAEAKGLEIKISYSENLHPVLTSEYRVHEILQNFMSNAIKYTEKGYIELRAEPSSQEDGSVIFSVKDTGIGISSSDKKHLFSKFYRSEDFRTRKTGGTGLGLYITNKLAERLSGKIWFDSKLNKGSTFYLQVPPVSRQKRDQKKVVTAQVDNFVNTL